MTRLRITGKAVSLAVLFYACVVARLWAFDWRDIHAQADALTASKQPVIIMDTENREEELYRAALMFLNRYNNGGAYNTFIKILGQNPKSIPARWGVAEVLRRRHQIDESRKLLEDVLAEDPTFAPAMISLAYIKYQTFDFMGAVNLGMKAVGLGPRKMDATNYVRAYLISAGAKGMVAHYGGPVSKLVHGTKVFSMLKKAESLQPDTAPVMFGLGAFYVLAPSIIGGNLAMAEKYLKRAVELDPLLVDAYVRLAQVYKRQNNERKYLEYLQKALQLDPQNELALDVQSNACKYICLPVD